MARTFRNLILVYKVSFPDFTRREQERQAQYVFTISVFQIIALALY